MKKHIYIGAYILGITLLMILMIVPVTVKASELSDDDKISINITMTVPQDFSGELRIRYYDTIGGLPDHIFFLTERSKYDITVRMLPGKFAYKSTEIDGSPMDESLYKIAMPAITVVNDSRSNKEFKGELIRLKEEPLTVTTTPVEATTNNTDQDIKPLEENKYFGYMTEKEIFEWFKEQMEKIIKEDKGDPPLSMLTNIEWKTSDLLHFCSYSMKKKVIKNTEDLMREINSVAVLRDKDSDYYKTIAKTYIYVYEEWQKGNQVSFVFEEEENNEPSEEYLSLVDDLTDFGITDDTINNSNKPIDNDEEEIIDGLILVEENESPNKSKEQDGHEGTEAAINDEVRDNKNNNKFISFLKKGGISFIVVIVVGVIWVIIKRKKDK